MNVAVTAAQPVRLCSAPIAAGSNTFGRHYSAVAATSQGGRWGPHMGSDQLDRNSSLTAS